MTRNAAPSTGVGVPPGARVRRRRWARLWYLLPLALLHPQVFVAAVNLLTEALNASDRLFGWDWHEAAFALMRWLDPGWQPGAR